MEITQVTEFADAGGNGTKLAAVAANTVYTIPPNTTFLSVYATVQAYYRQGTTPVATVDGTDKILVSGNKVRIRVLNYTPGISNNKMAFNAASASDIYIYPE